MSNTLNKIKTVLSELIYPLMWLQSSKYDASLDKNLNEELDTCSYMDWWINDSHPTLKVIVLIKLNNKEYWVYKWKSWFSKHTSEIRPSRKTIRRFMKCFKEQNKNLPKKLISF